MFYEWISKTLGYRCDLCQAPANWKRYSQDRDGVLSMAYVARCYAHKED